MLVRGDGAPPERLRRTPIWLVERAEQAVHHPVLVHLGDEPPEGFESFGRLIEIVSAGDESCEKLNFWAAHDVGELLIADRQEHVVSWMGLEGREYKHLKRSRLLGLGAAGLARQIDSP